MGFLNQSDGAHKMGSLVNTLTDVDRRRLYYLSIATCYCNPNALRALIDTMQKHLRIAEIYLYLDRRSAITIGQAELNSLQQAYPELLYIFAVRAGCLFHTKGYCLAAYEGDNLVEGRLAIGSANLTNSDLINANGNIESLVTYSDIPFIAEFLDFFERDNILIELDDLTTFSPDHLAEDLVDFQYALLTAGVFCHKWSATLSRYFSVRYQLNEKGRQLARAQADLRGFEVEALTVAKSYFNFDVRRWRSTEDRVTKAYGVECFLGRWVPKSVFRGDERTKKQLRRFKQALFDELDARMSELEQEILEDYEAFVLEEIIDELDTEPTTRFRERIEVLRNDDDLLYRIWSGRYYFELPYDVGHTEGISETYEGILLTIKLSKKKNRTMKAVTEAVETRDLTPIQALSSAAL